MSLSSAADNTAVQSTTLSPVPDWQPQMKNEKFEEHHKTDETSDANVLSEF